MMPMRRNWRGPRAGALAFTTIVGLCLAVGGCSSPSRSGGGPAQSVNEMHLLGSGVHRVDSAPDDCPVCAVYERNHGSVVRVRVPGGVGAGVVVSASGDIITNAHVVGENKLIVIETYHGTIVRGHVERVWKEADLAIVTSDSGDVHWLPMAFGPAAFPRVGTTTYAIGHPVGLGWTVTQGIISGRRRAGEVGPLGMIQTDAAVSPGNSGGPLLDEQSRWVGVVSSKLVGPGLENVSFAVPIVEVRRFYEESTASPVTGGVN